LKELDAPKRCPERKTGLEDRHVSVVGMLGMNAQLREGHDVPWVLAHEALSRLAKARARADSEEGRWLLAARRSAVHVHLGFGSFGEYVERLFGYSRRFTREKLRVAEALEELPLLTHALSDGSLSWSAVRELSRVAVLETQREWLEFAKDKTARQLEECVAGKAPGARPASPSDDAARRHVLRFEVEPETLAVFRQAQAELRHRAGSALSDDALLLEMARHVLGGSRDERRATYQLALTVCTVCGAGRQDAGSDIVVVSPEVVEMARCDAQHLGRLDAHVSRDVQPANDAVAPHVGRAKRDISSDKGPARHNVAFTSRAKQDVPPAVRRAVLRRDHGRCRVPGCRNSAFLDVHHIVPRSEGGGHHAENLVTVCGAHHRALHRGELEVQSKASTARFQHADGSFYGGVANPKTLDLTSKVFSALRGLGFREAEVRAVLGELRTRDELHGACIQDWLRAALARLTPAHRAHAGAVPPGRVTGR
jgi:hypothetical protein